MNGFRKILPLQTASTIQRFLYSPNYCIVVMALAAVAHILAWELPAYILIAGIFIYTCLLGDDLLPIMPLFLASYIIPSAGNNPGKNPHSVFSGTTGMVILVLTVCMAISLVFRIIRDRKQFFRKKGKCLLGMLLLAGAYFLSGIGSAAYPQYLKNNLLFALMQSLSLILPYWIFSRGVNWKNVRWDYFAWIGFATGGVLALEILWSYCTQDVIVNGIIRRERIYTGWGMYNNMGFLLAMMIPFAFYLATKYRRGWIGTVVGSAYLICVLMTCSRTSILCACLIYILCVVIMLLYARNRRHNTIALTIVITLIVAVVALFHNQILRLFSSLLGKGLDSSSRDDVYTQGLKLFTQYPIFGASFFSPGFVPWDFSTLEDFSSLIPPRWHNTIVQLLASCGVVGLGAYLFHRVQTVKILLVQHHKEQVFIGCAVLVLLLCSLLDCHFFNLAPTMFYSMALAYAEFIRAPEVA